MTLVCRRGFMLEAHARAEGFRHVALGYSSRFSPLGDARDVAALRGLITSEKIDVIHVHRGKDHWIGMAAALLTGIPLVRTRHVVTPVRQHFMNRWLYSRATSALLSVSSAAERSFGRLIERIPNHRVILSAVDHERFSPARRSEKWRKEHSGNNASGEPVWIGLIGRIQHVKGQDNFLRAAALVAAQCPEARFLIAGRGGPKKRAKYLRFANDHGFGDRLTIKGTLDNLPEVMASLDIGVVASIGSEGSSRVTLELMASSVPVVVTRVGGIPELMRLERDGAPPPDAQHIQIGEFGLLVPPGDAEAMAEAMIRLVRDPALRSRMGEAGRRTAVRDHDPGRWAGAIEETYRTAIEARR